jgi:predicted permease
VIIEVTLAAVLLVGALLLGRSFQALQRVDLGFRAPGLVSIDITLPESRYGSWAAQTAAFAAIIDRVNAVPGVQGAATVIGGPLNVGGAVGHSFRIDGWSPPDPSVDPSARSRPVGGDYFRVMDIPILAGRPFDDRDVATAMPVAIVNQSFARGVWGSDDPIGHRLAWRFSDGPPRWITVVGVAGDVRAGSLRDGDEPAVYTPYPQREPGWERFGVLMVRGDRAAADLTREVRRAVLSVDPGLPIGRSLTMEDAAGEVLTAERLGASIFVVFSLVAALMAGQGVYGLLAFVVSTRRREMGIRLALGAAPREVVALILSHGVALVATGLALGLIVGSALSRLVSAQLYGISSGDPLTYLTAATGLMLVAVVAAWLPAQRAAGVDPGVVLREE